MPHLALWQWLLGAFNAFTVGAAKTGVPGGGTLVVVPIVVAGGFAGLWLIHRVPQRLFEWLVVALTTVSLFLLFR